ncbi:MAG: hypothetical protein WAO35_20330 [Terriglobia bacterium]
MLLTAYCLPPAAFAQQPQAQAGQEIFPVNAKFVQGFGPGYWPTAGSNLTLNLAPGTAVCSNTVQTYAGGALTLAPSATNYVYLNTANNCAPASNTTGFTSASIPIATVVTTSAAISSITDVRTMFVSNGGSGSGSVTSVAMTGDGIIYSATVSGSPITSTGTFAPQLLAQTANMVLAGPGTGTAATPTFRALASADLPATISSNTTGKAATATALASSPTQCGSNNWATGISTSGNANCSRPGFSNLGGTATVSQGGTGQTTASGAFNTLSPLSTEGDFLYYHSSANTRLGVGSNGQCLTSNGSDPVWGSCSGSSSLAWSTLVNPTANLTLAMSTYTTTFNHTAAANWTWANTTAATSGTAQSSPLFNLSGTYWNGSASATDSWSLQDVVANGTNGNSTLTLAHTGSIGTAALSVPNLTNTSTTQYGVMYGGGASAAEKSTAAGASGLPLLGQGSAAPVFGTLGLAGGGTGQTTAAAAFNALSPLTTEGDLHYYHSSSNARLAIGGASTFLTSNGTDPSWGPLTGAGFGSQTANYILAAPNGSSGNPSFRSLVAADLPASITSNTTGNAATATALVTTPAQCSSGEVSNGITAVGAANCIPISSAWNALSTPSSYPNGSLALNTGGNTTSLYGSSSATSFLLAGEYVSGGTFTGSAGQYCFVQGFNGGGTGALATVWLTGTNTIASGTPLYFYSSQEMSGYTSAATSATLSNGSATCSGTVTVTTQVMGMPSSFQLAGLSSLGSYPVPQLIGVTSAGAGSLAPGNYQWCVSGLSDTGSAYDGANGVAPYWGQTPCSNVVSATVTNSSVNGAQTISWVPLVGPDLYGGWGNFSINGDLVVYRSFNGVWQQVSTASIPEIVAIGPTVTWTDNGTETMVANTPPTVDTSMQIICLPWGVWQGGMCTMDTAYFYLNSNLGSYMGGGIYTTSIGRNSAMPLGIGNSASGVSVGFDVSSLTGTTSGHACGPGSSAHCWDIHVPNADSTFVVPQTSATSHEWVQYVDGTGVQHLSQPSYSDLLGTLGISAGGTGQATAAAAFNALSPLTTEGDLLYYHSSANTRLGVGSNGQCLTSNGTDPLWGTCSSGSMTWPTFTGLAAYGGSSNWVTPTYASVVSLFASGSCSGYLYSNGTCSTPSGSLSGLTTGYIPQATSSTAIGNTSPVLDNGITTANTLTYAGTGGVTAPQFTANGTGPLTLTSASGSCGTSAASKVQVCFSSTNNLPAVGYSGSANENLQPMLISNFSSSAYSAAQSASTPVYLPASSLPVPNPAIQGIAVGSVFQWHTCFTKNANGTGAMSFIIYMGTNGSTSDTAEVTQALPASTAVIDTMCVDVLVNWTAVGSSSGAFYWSIAGTHTAASAAGFGLTSGTLYSGTKSSLNSTTAGLIMGLGMEFASGGTLPTVGIVGTQAHAYNLY